MAVHEPWMLGRAVAQPDQKRAVLQATAPEVLAGMRMAGLVSDQDFCLLLNISTGTDSDADIDLDEYRAVLTKRLVWAESQASARPTGPLR